MSVEVGGRRLGVRTTSPNALEELTARLDGYIVDDPDVFANYSLEVFDDPPGNKLHRLYESNRLALRSSSPAVLIEAIGTMLATHECARLGLPVLQSNLIGDATTAIVLPDANQLAAGTGKRGGPVSHPVWSGSFVIDPETAEVVLPSLGSDAPGHTASDEWDATILRPGRYRLAAQCHTATDVDEAHSVDGTDAVFTIAQLLARSCRSPHEVVDAAVKLADRGVDVVNAPMAALDDLVTTSGGSADS